MKYLALQVCALMTIAPVAFAAPGTTSFRDQGEASLTVLTSPGEAQQKITMVETRYLETEFPSFNIVKAVTTKSRITGTEGMNANVKLTMLTNDESGHFGKTLWTANVEGSETKMISEEFVGVIQYGCCGSSDITRLLNVKSGKEVEAAASDIFQLDVPNSGLPMRYVSLSLDSRAPKTFKGKEYLGTVSYFSGTKIIARARIYSDINQHPGWGASINDLRLVGLDGQTIQGNEPGSTTISLWPSNGVKNPESAYSGFELQATTSYDNRNESLTIVFANDTIDTAATTTTLNLAVDFVKY